MEEQRRAERALEFINALEETVLPGAKYDFSDPAHPARYRDESLFLKNLPHNRCACGRVISNNKSACKACTELSAGER